MEMLLLLIAHFLGDFVFQNANMARKKSEAIQYYFLHCVIYSGLIFVSLIFFGPVINMVMIFIVIVATHAMIDYCRILLLNRIRKQNSEYKSKDFSIFIFDQILHLLVIIGSVHFINDYSIIGNATIGVLDKHIEWTQMYNMLVYILLYIICMSPTAVFIKKVFVFFSIQIETEVISQEEMISSGYLIGILERIIILTLGLSGQLGAIGFVLAAKSLARFKQLEDKSFAEKYLLGTLLSVAISLFCITVGNFLIVK